MQLRWHTHCVITHSTPPRQSRLVNLAARAKKQDGSSHGQVHAMSATSQLTSALIKDTNMLRQTTQHTVVKLNLATCTWLAEGCTPPLAAQQSKYHSHPINNNRELVISPVIITPPSGCLSLLVSQKSEKKKKGNEVLKGCHSMRANLSHMAVSHTD